LNLRAELFKTPNRKREERKAGFTALPGIRNHHTLFRRFYLRSNCSELCAIRLTPRFFDHERETPRRCGAIDASSLRIFLFGRLSFEQRQQPCKVVMQAFPGIWVCFCLNRPRDKLRIGIGAGDGSRFNWGSRVDISSVAWVSIAFSSE
jgi:hypothetical protein